MIINILYVFLLQCIINTLAPDIDIFIKNTELL